MMKYWSPGPCIMPEVEVNISSSLSGVWHYRASQDFFPLKETIHPFFLTHFNYDCLKFILTYNFSTKELEMEYSCRKQFLRTSNCKIFVKFSQYNRIIYPATNCPKVAQLKSAMIGDTDYTNYLTIVDCQEGIGPNLIIVHQKTYIVLSRAAGSLSSEVYIKIKNLFENIYIIYTLLTDAELNKTGCTCAEFSCEAFKKKCYPVSNHNNLSFFEIFLSELKYSWIILPLIGVVFAIIFAILLIKHNANNKVGVVA